MYVPKPLDDPPAGEIVYDMGAGGAGDVLYDVRSGNGVDGPAVDDILYDMGGTCGGNEQKGGDVLYDMGTGGAAAEDVLYDKGTSCEAGPNVDAPVYDVTAGPTERTPSGGSEPIPGDTPESIGT